LKRVIEMKALSGGRGSLHGLADILAQAPLVAAAFGRWPGFVLIMTALLVVLAFSVITILVATKAATHAIG
jgi:hypothetical protein